MATVLKYDFSDYIPYTSKLTIEQQRKEYARLRKIANKRLATLGRSEFKDTKAYKRNIGKFVVPASKLSKADLRWQLQEVAKFLNAKTGSVTGLKKIRKEFLQTAHEHGLDFVTKDNYIDFGKFMDKMRDIYDDELFDSDEAADVFESVENIDVDVETLAEEFDYFLKHQDVIREIPEPIGKTLHSSKDVRKFLK